MSALAAVVVVGIGTYATRAVFIVVLAKRKISDATVRALEMVGPATLASLIVAMLIEDGQVQAGWPEVAGLTAAALTGWKIRNLMAMLTVGMVTYWVVRALV